MSDYAISTGARRLAVRRRRFVLVALVALAALAVALGISFTADTGTQQTSVTAGSTSPLVFTSSSGLPTNVVFRKSGTSSPGLPSWTPVAGAAGTVTTKGDLALIDGRTASAGGASNLIVTVYITNLAALQKDYSSFAFPIRIYKGDYDTSGTPAITWTVDGGNSKLVASSASSYLTNTGGFLSFTLPTSALQTDNFYSVQLAQDDTTTGAGTGDGGSFYAVSTNASGGDLNPKFFITAQPS